MSETTSRWELPLLHASQAQKEMTHNEALARIDMLLNVSVEAVGTTVPPTDPAPGQCWIVGAEALGEWNGRANRLAAWTEGGWRFAAPQHGMRIWSRADAMVAVFDGGMWQTGMASAASFRIAGQQVIGGRLPFVPSPGGGTVVDVEARDAIAAILDRLRTHGLIESG